MAEYFDKTGSKGFTVRIHYEAEPGKLTVTGVQVYSTIYYANVYYLTATVTVAGTKVFSCSSITGDHSFYPKKTGAWYDLRGNKLPPWSVDCTGAVTIQISFSGATISGESGHGWKVSGSHSVTVPEKLTTVILSAPDTGVLGQSITLSTPGANQEKTLTWQLGSGSGSLGTTTAEYLTWELPDSLAQYMSATTQTMVITCTSVGSSTAEVALTVPQRAPFLPVLTAALTPEGTALSIYVRGVSCVRGDLSAQCSYGSVTGLSMTVEGVTYTGSAPLSAPVNVSGSLSVVCRAENSWGFSAQTTKTITVEPYEVPCPIPYGTESQPVCARCDAQGSLSAVGTSILLRAGLRFHDLGGRNTATLSCRVKATSGSWGAWTVLLQTAGSVQRVLSGAAPSLLSGYQVQLRAEDSLGFYRELMLAVPTAAAAFHLKSGGLGAAFGKFCEEDRLVDITPDWDLSLKGSRIADHIVEVGENTNWYWHRYRSGFTQCFGRISGSVSYPRAFGALPGVIASGAAVTTTQTVCTASGTASVMVWGKT